MEDSALCVVEANDQGRVAPCVKKAAHSVFMPALCPAPRHSMQFGCSARAPTTYEVPTAEFRAAVVAYIAALCTAVRAGIIVRGTSTDPAWPVTRVAPSTLAVFVALAVAQGVRDKCDNAENAAEAWLAIHDRLACFGYTAVPIKDGGCIAPPTLLAALTRELPTPGSSASMQQEVIAMLAVARETLCVYWPLCVL